MNKQFLITLCAAVVLSACSSPGSRERATGDYDYLDTKGLDEGFQTPEELDAPTRSNRYDIPNLDTSESRTGLIGDQVRVSSPRLVLPLVAGSHVEEGSEDATVLFDQVDDSQALEKTIWDKVLTYLEQNNIGVESFDEQNNIEWAKVLSSAGIKVIFGIPALKVHSKLCVIHRKEKNKIVKYAHIGTGNFHEKTAKIYTDFSLFTKHNGICEECDSVFKFIESSYKPFNFEYLMLSPINARDTLLDLIDKEIQHVEDGFTGKITIKVNNLVDKQLVDKLYYAGRRGVKIRIIVRGMCSLIPGVAHFSENIKVISIVDRFLEHPRVMVFGNNGNDKVYISSADWMTRNLDQRVEVGVPILNNKLKQLIMDILELQFKDRTKARLIDSEQKNTYVRRGNRKKIRSQIAIYDHLKKWEGNYNNE